MKRTLLIVLMLASQGLAAALAEQRWDGPRSGPPRQPGHYQVLYLAQDLRNGGIAGSYRAFATAAGLLGWQLQIIDGKGSSALLRQALASAVSERRVQGVVLGGIATSDLRVEIGAARQAGIPLVGWHATATPGAQDGLFFNVTTDPQEVARLAASYVIQQSQGKAGVVIFNDERFDIANAKTRFMQQTLAQCKTCKLLSVENIPINHAAERMDAVVRQLNQRYGKQWTHTLAINDVYFDEMNYPLLHVRRTDIRNVSAGDGSSKAISRIRAGLSQQSATVAEPLAAQGWQMADELNRAFAHASPSGYASKPILLTREVLQQLGEQEVDAALPYQQAYRAIWRLH
ncbi:substrate-binding domain-containing protein [Aquitalea sp. LB_tupeE]|uniref:substrate-binding domain-containing protein n=1 Tax=Aquitalea sp. LB_tupeE TaxID=2748078 RepID=UPI0015C04FDC|nr:substrate-binding domain-containing protein [Aquitalea sp. LB_tupeE]NWK76378.1 substrate-binding domain-containing protein [Aquitalea sp. LB_tupeE]